MKLTVFAVANGLLFSLCPMGGIGLVLTYGFNYTGIESLKITIPVFLISWILFTFWLSREQNTIRKNLE